MSREIEKDYDYMISFLASYQLTDIVEQGNLMQMLKTMHRKLYAYMVFLNEMESKSIMSKNETIYHRETVSDMISALFCWVNGTYKSSKLHLRSGIESFVKAITCNGCPEILITKSVYEVFDLAKQSHEFSFDYTKNKIESLHSEYASLCATVHGSMDKMAGVGGLIQFPCYTEKEAKEISDVFLRIISSYLSTIYYVYYDNVYEIHELNRDLFLQGIEKSEKKIIYNLINS